MQTKNHPLEKFSFCPVCGSSRFVVNNFKSKRCEDCGFVYYANPCAATVALIVNERGELLVARRGKEPAKGTLDLCGGFSDMYETSEEGLAREVKEETGLDVVSAQFLFSIPNLYVYSGMTIHTLDFFYRCEVRSLEGLRADDDVAELMWMAPADIRPEAFGLMSIRKGVERFVEGKL